MLGVYKLRTRRDRDKNGSGLTEYVRRGVICRRLKHLQIAISKSIYSEVTIAKRKWLSMSIYRQPNYNNLDTVFNEITIFLIKASLNYERFIINGDFNIDISTKNVLVDRLEEFCCIFDLVNSIKQETCLTKNDKSLIDLSLTKRPSLSNTPKHLKLVFIYLFFHFSNVSILD